jgi:hypothetical protein
VSERRPHPVMSDIALAAVTRQVRERSVSATYTNDNAKTENRITVNVTDPDPEFVGRTLIGLTNTLLAEYPRDNGNAS